MSQYQSGVRVEHFDLQCLATPSEYFPLARSSGKPALNATISSPTTSTRSSLTRLPLSSLYSYIPRRTRPALFGVQFKLSSWKATPSPIQTPFKPHIASSQGLLSPSTTPDVVATKLSI